MYLDTMEEMLAAAGLQKIIISRDAKGNILPLLNLDATGAFAPSPSPDQTPSAGGARQ
jgi:hypothetical protein